MNKTAITTILVIPVIILVVLLVLGSKKSDGKTKMGETPSANKTAQQESSTDVMGEKTVTPPTMTIDKTKKYQALMNTSEGIITIDLYADKTPITVNNFVTLAKQNFYNNTIFHRTIKDFMIQGGDPKGDGTGGPGYKFNDEPFEGEYTAGTIAMANAGPNTNGSQFFIMHKDNPLPKNYVIFGKVSDGMDVVNKIATAPVEMSPMGEPSKPVTPVQVKSIEILEN